MFRFRRRPPLVEFAFCERPTATEFSPWHIRRLGPDGLKPAGGVAGVALCGRDMTAGWDVRVEVTVAVARQAVAAADGDRVRVCQGCFDVYRQTVRPGTGL